MKDFCGNHEGYCQYTAGKMACVRKREFFSCIRSFILQRESVGVVQGTISVGKNSETFFGSLRYLELQQLNDQACAIQRSFEKTAVNNNEILMEAIALIAWGGFEKSFNGLKRYNRARTLDYETIWKRWFLSLAKKVG